MAGLGRVQQRFNAAVVGVLATLVTFARGGTDKQVAERLLAEGHPILAKLLKHDPPNKTIPGQPYLGYCLGIIKRTAAQRTGLLPYLENS